MALGRYRRSCFHLPSANDIAFTTQPVVRVADAGGNTVAPATDAITVALKAGTGTAGATLSGTVMDPSGGRVLLDRSNEDSYMVISKRMSLSDDGRWAITFNGQIYNHPALKAELEAEGVRFLSVDPGDMDTPFHALAMPDADPATLKRPELAARELADLVAAALSRVGHLS